MLLVVEKQGVTQVYRNTDAKQYQGVIDSVLDRPVYRAAIISRSAVLRSFLLYQVSNITFAVTAPRHKTITTLLRDLLGSTLRDFGDADADDSDAVAIASAITSRPVITCATQNRV